MPQPCPSFVRIAGYGWCEGLLHIALVEHIERAVEGLGLSVVKIDGLTVDDLHCELHAQNAHFRRILSDGGGDQVVLQSVDRGLLTVEADDDDIFQTQISSSLRSADSLFVIGAEDRADTGVSDQNAGSDRIGRISGRFLGVDAGFYRDTVLFHDLNEASAAGVVRDVGRVNGDDRGLGSRQILAAFLQKVDQVFTSQTAAADVVGDDKGVVRISAVAIADVKDDEGDVLFCSQRSDRAESLGLERADEQSIEQSLSTFSAHMSNIVQILREVDDQSLLLFDELGAGTDPIEGAALAIAIIESARSQGALIAATTHYAELKTFAMTTAGVENASCEFDVQTLRPTYRLLIGIPGKSNAFAISRRLGLDESVIQAAQQQMDSDSVRFEDVLTQLEEKRQRLEKAQAEADRLWRQREEDARKARTFREQMEKAKENARTKGEAEAKRIVRQAQAQADEIFAQLDQLRRQQQKQINFQELNDAKAAVRHSLNQAQEALHLRSEPQEPAYAPSRPIEVGDLVELPGVKMAASVLAVNNDGTLLLQAGKMKMTVKAQQVRLPEGQPKKKPAAPVGGSPKLNLQPRASSELDIRGYETLEAESVVENYIDSAVMAKLGTVTIIHGKGTGALRKAVHEMLKRNKAVKSFRLGRYGEGEAGVTVVELK